MSDDDQTQPVRPGDPAPAAAPSPAASPTPSLTPSLNPPPAAGEGSIEAATPPPTTGRRGFRERFRAVRQSDGDRAYSLGALIASALAGVIIGGVGVTAVLAVTSDHHDRDGWMEQRGSMGRDGDDFGGRGPMHGGPPGVPGQVQPTTSPEDEGSAS